MSMHRLSLLAGLTLAACSAEPPSEVPTTFTGPSSHYEGFFLAGAQELARNDGVVTIAAGH